MAINFLKNRVNLFLTFGLILITLSGFVVVKSLTTHRSEELLSDERDIAFDAEGPYGLLIPRRDGNALILNLKRTASYEAISYELTYNAEGIDRGVVGNVDTSVKKGEYEQEILFGTCSKNVCKYDKGVGNGTLTLHISKGRKRFKLITLWHIQKPIQAKGGIVSPDNHFSYLVLVRKEDLEETGFSIVNDLSAAPKLPSGKVVLQKVYSLNIPLAKTLPPGQVRIELANKPPSEAKIAQFDENQGAWKLLDTKIESSTLTATVDGGGIFTVLINSK